MSAKPPPLPSDAPAPPPLPTGPHGRMEDNLGSRMVLPVGRSGWAIASGYLGLFSILLLPAPVAVLTGVLALREIKAKANSPVPVYGMGRAWFGIITGVLGTLAMIALITAALFRS